jgi:hypothetical protein
VLNRICIEHPLGDIADPAVYVIFKIKKEVL